MSPIYTPGIDPPVAVVSIFSKGLRRNDLGEAAYVLRVVGIGKAVGVVACLEFHDIFDMDIEDMLSKGSYCLLTVIRGHLVEVHGVQSQPNIVFANHIEKAEARRSRIAQSPVVHFHNQLFMEEAGHAAPISSSR